MKKSEQELMHDLANAKRESAKKYIDLYFKEVISPFFPQCRYNSFTDEYIKGVHLGIGGVVSLRPYNYILKGSKY